MEGPVVEDLGAPDSWEVADLDANLSRLMLRDSNSSKKASSESLSADSLNSASVSGSFSSTSAGTEKVSQDAINQVDQFLREALQNPRERLSVLRMEQAVEKFIRDPNQQQLEFPQLPTSYLRLAAHRVAQHYSLHSMVLSDNNLSDSSGSRIIVCKTSECRLPMIRLADIPVNLSSEDSGVVKVAIKQRPQKQSQTFSNSNSSKKNNSRSVEERKEEYNRARARIFNSSNSNGGSSKLEIEPKLPDTSQHASSGISRLEQKSFSGLPDVNSGRCLIESSTSSSRSTRGRSEKDPVGRYKPNNRVAIFRDREVERTDPDYDRSYDRYMQRFDPGFGFSGGSYTMQPMYTPAVTYNSEFPQLGSTHRPHISVEHQSRQLPQHLPGPWTAPSSPAGIGYGHPETIMTSFNPNHVGSHTTSAIYMHSSQYQHPGLPYMHHEHVHPPFSQSHQQQPDTSFGLARPR
ncbi:R3H domain-containing protein 2-like isoform X1 [Tripterygium wilfordii]|uniref:R3H domain-containing protein 2-like isoform X1 n=1 Tax=Tripterygium wilfordii TaxID=458696 RepID=A0A7J7D8F8_TRIWF|nr:R3H domain-containing protein 2-like [Tripterygium wilfordii]KAF5742613.1 R3H domain-containing protein 2-like isoform X1 [Tripterygium wilfordii]